ncbi:nitrogen fixation protein NifZ [Methylocystis sp. JAN1]|uniref:nitrogen fixation protein NifZ n=1 Tax=Methylocystis sp. JAN1 TaxID=3397211 RepID=UPI003FA1EA06
MSGPAKFDWGMRVRATTDLVNDGSYPDRADDELLVKSGDTGEIVNVGMHVETETPVYLVEFSPQLVIGCLEDEIEPA